MLPPLLLEKIIAFTGKVMEVTDLSGGCIHRAERLKTEKGTFFLKWNLRKHAYNFEVEARGLSLLAANSSLRIPQVIGRGNSKEHAFILMEFIEQGPSDDHFWKELGLGLAQLHLKSRPDFGWEYDNYIGSLLQYNSSHTHWLDFFINERIHPQLFMPQSMKVLGTRLIKKCEDLMARLEGFFPEEPPALIHGDLWGGNLLSDKKGKPVLIDPAVYYGHREAEIAYMTLFDSQPTPFYESYQSVYPLAPGWKERLPLYNLYPLLVHVNLFGSSYADSVERIVDHY